jgi:hypothetical protein
LRIATSEALRLHSLCEEYDQLVSDLLTIITYLLGESEHASRSSTDVPFGTA